MSANDVVWMVLTLGGAGWLLYRSLWQKRGQCHGCSGCSCGTGKKREAGRSSWP